MASFTFQPITIDTNSLNDGKYVKRLTDYLSMQNENMRYMFSSLDGENLSDDYNNMINKMMSDTEGNTSLIKQTASDIMLVVTNISSELDNAEASIQINAQSIISEVSRSTLAEGDLSTRITQTEDEIELKVSKNGIVSAINQSAEQISIQASKISLEGYTTINGGFAVELDGSVTVSGNVSVRDNLLMYNSTEEVNGIPGKYFNCMRIISEAFSGTTSYYLDLGYYGEEGAFADLLFAGDPVITTANKANYTFEPNVHYQNSTTINPVLTVPGGNVGLNGINVASVNWVTANFVAK